MVKFHLSQVIKVCTINSGNKNIYLYYLFFVRRQQIRTSNISEAEGQGIFDQISQRHSTLAAMASKKQDESFYLKQRR